MDSAAAATASNIVPANTTLYLIVMLVAFVWQAINQFRDILEFAWRQDRRQQQKAICAFFICLAVAIWSAILLYATNKG